MLTAEGKKEIDKIVGGVHDEVVVLARRHSETTNVNVALMAKLAEQIDGVLTRLQRLENDVETLKHPPSGTPVMRY